MVLYHLVRRWFGEPAAVLASLALALTPVAVVIFRYNDPDAFLTLLLVLAAWAVGAPSRPAGQSGSCCRARWSASPSSTKTLDAFIVVPALGAGLLWCGPPRLARRIGQLGWAALALVVSSGWWVAIVELWPRSARPYIGGSTDNSELNLIFGYNGFARIFGREVVRRHGGATSSGSSAFGGGEGLLRMFDSELADRSLGSSPWPSRSPGRPVADTAQPTQRPPARRVRALGRHAPDVPGGVRRREGDLSPVLHRGDGAGCRRPRRRRRRGPGRLGRRRSAGLGASHRHRGHRGLG